MMLAASHDATLFSEMRWRAIGPFRGGRTQAASGVAGHPNLFYMGVSGGGVWKTTDSGRTWQPLFDDQPTGTIGAIAVAPSDANVIYVGASDGLYQSTDAGKNWSYKGLRDGRQIPQIVVDPRNASRLFVAVLGHPYGPNPERGIYRSTDGGQTFERVLYQDENTGGNGVALDPSNPDVVYAALWEVREAPWENARFGGSNGGIFKSTDGGSTWRPLTNGLPPGVTQANLAIAPGNSSRIYATVSAARAAFFYRSDDAGESWVRATNDYRPSAFIGGEDLPAPAVDPKNPDIVYSAGVAAYRSTDGAKTWTAIRGAPGGDNYRRIWINPMQSEIFLLAGDQGAAITVNGGETWSSWYNQPTAQLFHVDTDNDFPYRVCSGQMQSGSVCVSSRGNQGQVTIPEWTTAGVDADGYAVPDPRDPNLVFGGKVTRYDRRTGQVAHVAPSPANPADYRAGRTAPLAFSAADPHMLFFGANTLWRTSDGGGNWTPISPDLTRKTWDLPASIGKYRAGETAKPAQRAVIHTIAPSPLNIGRIWVGTDDGLIQTTADGGLHWQNVTPPQVAMWAEVAAIDAGHFDALTAYAAIDTTRIDERRPHIFCTRDGGKTWTRIVNGIPEIASVYTVREDPRKKGLLFAGTDRGVYVSFDDGANWQSLRLNMPATPVRDLGIKNGDLIAATFGRGFWILDDVAPLRQFSDTVTASPAYLFKPEPAYRVRGNRTIGTPQPPDEPAGQNPPDGAILDYYLASPAFGVMTLEIFDRTGALVRRYSSTDVVEPDEARRPFPDSWLRPPHPLSNQPGLHRFVWDLHYTPLGGSGAPSYTAQAVYHDTAMSMRSIWAAPGRYTVKLTVNGETYTQPLTVKADPRVKLPPGAMQQQFTLAKQLYDDAAAAQAALDRLDALRRKVWRLMDQAKNNPAVAEAMLTFDRKAAGVEGGAPSVIGPGGGSRAIVPVNSPSLSNAIEELAGLIDLLEQSDTVTTQLMSAASARRLDMAKAMAHWTALTGSGLAGLNTVLQLANLPTVAP
jgi:photosystem II stability/assembly factor-like uncharacterized protein